MEYLELKSICSLKWWGSFCYLRALSHHYTTCLNLASFGRWMHGYKPSHNFTSLWNFCVFLLKCSKTGVWEVGFNIFFSYFLGKVELNEIESRCEEYPLTIAFCRLISTLVESSFPSNLGAGLRPPGFDPYLQFLRDSVFLRFRTRAYRRAAEKVRFAFKGF